METAVGHQNMQVGMKSEKISERLYGDNRSRDRLCVTQARFVKNFQSLPAATA